MTTTRSGRAHGWVGLAIAAAMAAGACSDGPTDPGEGFMGTISDDLPTGAPPLPAPASLFADVPITSDTLTVIRPLTGAYRPLVSRAFGDWELEGRQCITISFSDCMTPGPWQPAGTVDGAWSDELPTVAAGSALNLSMALEPPAGRILLVEDGVAVASTRRFEDGRPQGVFPFAAEAARTLAGPTLASPVYLRRDRYWQWIPLSSAVGDYLIVTDMTESTLASTFTAGTARTETEEFGRSVTASLGLNFGPLQASVSGTLSATYSVSVEVHEESSETFERTVRGSPGVQTRFMIWILRERYTFTDAEGNAFADPSYEFVGDTLRRSGVATVLQATQFPLS